MGKKMIVYTTSWCGDCRKLNNQLKENHISFEEKDIERDEKAYETMMGHTKGKRVIPTVDIEGNILINPSFEKVQAALSA